MTVPIFQNDAGSGSPWSDFGLLGLFDPETVLLIRETVGKITGLPLLVLDADGRELAGSAASSPLCRGRRDKSFSPICSASDKYGADQAHARQEPFVYFCPCGLVRAVIPVIMRGRYLGGFYLGQVRCDNAPRSASRLERLLNGADAAFAERHSGGMSDATPTYDFSYFVYITETLARIISKITGREAELRAAISALEAEKAAFENRVRLLERELDLRESTLNHWKSRLNLEFTVNGLNSIASLAVIEGAPRVNELCSLFADHLRHYIAVEKDFALLREEADMVANYLGMQRIRFGESLTYSIDVSEQAGRYRFPTRVLLPLVEYSLLAALAAREEGAVLTLAAGITGDVVSVRIGNNAPVAADSVSLREALPQQSGFDTDAVAASLAAARNRLRALLGSRFELRLTDSVEGSVWILRYVLPHQGDPA